LYYSIPLLNAIKPMQNIFQQTANHLQKWLGEC